MVVVPKMLAKYASKISDIDIDSDGWIFVHLNDGWINELSETHCVSGMTWKDIAKEFRLFVSPCKCADCIPK